MYKKPVVLFIILLVSIFVNASPVKDISLETAIQKEMYVKAFRDLEAAFKKESGLQKDTLSYYLFQLADCLFKTRYITGLEKVLSITEKHHTLISPYYYDKIKLVKANYLKDKSDLDNAYRLLNSLMKACKYADIKTDITLSLASLYLMKGNTTPARQLAQSVFTAKINDTFQLATAANNIGACLAYESKYDSAKYYYSLAFELLRKELGKQHSKTAQVHFNLALIENKFGNYTTSEKIIQQVLKTYQHRLGEKHIRTAEAYGTLGSIYLLQDNLEKALCYIIKERDILTALYGKNHTDIAYSYLNCGKIYYYLNDLPAAEHQFNLGISLLKTNKQTQSNTYTELILEQSKLFYKQKEYSKSNTLLQSIPGIDDEYKADAYVQLGENHLAVNKPTEAKGFFIAAENIYTKIYGPQNIHAIDACTGISNCYLQEKNFIRAVETARSTTKRTIRNHVIVLPYDHWECRLQEMLCVKECLKQDLLPDRNYKAYIEDIKSIIAEANQIKQTYYATGSQQYYSEKIAALNELGIYFLTHFYQKADTYFIDNLLFFSENNKANLLRHKIISHNTNEILPAKEKYTALAITDKMNYFISLNEKQEDVAFNINDSILFYQNKYESFTKLIEQKYPKIYALKYGNRTLHIQQIQKKLKTDETFLSYCHDGENYYCVSISKQNITYKVCGKKDKIDLLISTYLSSVLNKKTDNKLSKQLCIYLMPAQLNEHLIVATDGSLSKIPFDALRTGGNTFLLNSHTFDHTFSAQTYFNHSPTVMDKRVVAFYPDFTHSTYAVLNNQDEHATLKNFKDYNVFYKQNASKLTFVQQCNNAGILHIASHLVVDTAAPLRSSLVFQPNVDYLLSINDIWKLNANCQLLTLAACQSNFGKLQTGEGTQSFAWAFHYAGAHHILSTQWDAADKATSEIIGNFYENLYKGQSKRIALQAAKLAYLQQTDAIGAEPYFWANFHLFSDATSIEVAPKFLSTFWWLPIFLLCLLFISILTYKKIYLKYYKE